MSKKVYRNWNECCDRPLGPNPRRRGGRIPAAGFDLRANAGVGPNGQRPTGCGGTRPALCRGWGAKPTAGIDPPTASHAGSGGACNSAHSNFGTLSNILNSALSGKKLSKVLIVDGHGHLDYWKAGFRFSPTSAEEMLADMDRIGIDILCINKWNCPDVEEANRDVAKVIRQYPDRFVGFVTTGPSLGKEFNLTQLKRGFEEWGFRGIKVHNGYEAHLLRDQTLFPEYEETMEEIWRFAAERRCPVLCHGFLSPDIARRYPQAIFIAAHAGGVRQYAHLYGGCPNVYFDTASSTIGRGSIEYFVQKVGAERVLYGSDMPYANPAFRMGQVLATKVDDTAMKKILGENMARILGIKKVSRGSE